MHEAVIEKLRGEQLCHKNDLTGCEIWTGEFNRAHEPVAHLGVGKMNVQEYLYLAASGEAVTRNELVKMKCENDACILPAHMQKEVKKRKVAEPLPDADVENAARMYFDKGMRIEAIVEAKEPEGWTKPYVTRLVAEARSRRGASQ